MKHVLTVLLAASIMLISGCVTFEEPAEPSGVSETTTSAAGQPGAGGNTGSMTAKETTSTVTSSCSRASVAALKEDAASCATKTHWIEGTIGLDALPVTLGSFNGDVDVRGGTAGRWNLTVVLRARGETDATARANLDNIQFAWSHEDGAAHHLKAEAKKKSSVGNNQEAASMTLIVPASVLITLDGSTSNGDAAAQGIRATTVRLVTSNGRVTAQDLEAKTIDLSSSNGAGTATTVAAERIGITTTNGAINVVAAARDYTLQTTNGGIEARLRPSASGTITMGTTNGPISLAVPEGAKHGHDVKASATNGMVTINLKDGTASGSTNSKTFKTTDYASRSIQSKSTLTGTNAMITVSPL